jgi:oligopeptide/dipeptide ABC transporter ATP-binding protein
LLQIENLSIVYGDEAVVDGLNLAIDKGAATGLVGESGSGKTQTALSVLGLTGARAEVRGSVRFDGKELIGASEPVLDDIRGRRISMIFQDPMQALNPYLRIGKQMRYILERHGIAAGEDADRKSAAMLAAVGLPDPDRQLEAYPHQLSGGMRQRAMIAMALITGPELLIADEPTTALDVTVQAQVLELLDELRAETAMLLITHDLGVVAEHCEQLFVLENGRVVESGLAAEVFRAPSHPHTQRLLEAAPRIDDEGMHEQLDTAPLLVVEDAEVNFTDRGRRRLRAVRGVGLSLRAGETVSIVGESGSGKSSLVKAVLGLVPSDAGTVTFLGAELAGDVRDRAARTRRDLQLVFQDPAGSLDPQMTIETIVAEPLLVHEPGLTADERQKRVENILEQVGLADDYRGRYPHELSGGQAQRVAIARALVVKPRVLVCDEAVAALDGSVREQILGLLRHVQRRSGLSILFISHDLGVVRSISHRIMVMYLGRVVEAAANDSLFARPRHPYTRALIDAVPVPDPSAARTKKTLGGEVPSPLQPPGGCPFHPRCEYAVDRCIAERPPLQQVGAATVACHRAEELTL